MQTKIRKPIGILLTLAMLLSVFAGMTFTAGAASSGTCGETHDVNTITGFFTDMLHDMLYIITRLARFFCYEIFVS